MNTRRLFAIICTSFNSFCKSIPCFFSKPQLGRAKIVIRFDDYGVWCNSDWITIEEEILKLHELYGVKISFGVIPNSKYPLIAHPLSPSVYPKEYENLDNNPYPLSKGSKRVAILKESVQKGISEVALHGLSHPKGYSNTLNTEFYGLPYDLQYSKLLEGKNQLEYLFDCKVSTFIPPHNTYDNLTLDLLHDLGFKCVSGCHTGSFSPRCDSLNLQYLWFKYDNLEDFDKELFGRRHYEFEPLSVIMLHHTNFTKNGKIDYDKITEYERFLCRICENKIPSYCFSDVPENEIKIFNTNYFLRHNDIVLRILQRYKPAVASNLIDKKINK